MFEWLTGPVVFSILAAICGIIAAGWSHVQDIAADKEEARHRAEETRLLNKLDSKNEEIIAHDKSIIEGLTDAVNHLTGGDSVFYLDIKASTSGDLEALYAISGKYSVSNIHILVERADTPVQLVTLSDQAHQMRREGAVFRHIPAHAPNMPLKLDTFPFGDSKTGYYLVTILQPNGTYKQVIAIEKDSDGRMLVGFMVYQVHRTDDGKFNRMEKLSSPSRIDGGLSEAAVKLVESLVLSGPGTSQQ